MKRKKTIETGFRLLFLICGLIAVAFVLLISIYLIIAGIPAIREVGLINFLFGDTWNAGTNEFGILPFILTSVYGTAGAVVIGVPIGIMTALYLSKVAPPKISKLVNTAVELLAGIPSVIYGLVGMIVVVPAVQSVFGLSSGACLLTAILVLAVMILPYIINISKTALDAVPPEYEEASLALGALRTETYFKVSLPAAKRGIATAVVQGVGRAGFVLGAGIAELIARVVICAFLPAAVNGAAIDSSASPGAFCALCLADPGAWIAGALVLLVPLVHNIARKEY